jgi:hypothetical protein
VIKKHRPGHGHDMVPKMLLTLLTTVVAVPSSQVNSAELLLIFENSALRMDLSQPLPRKLNELKTTTSSFQRINTRLLCRFHQSSKAFVRIKAIA